jgi:hypothetical protein
MLSLVSVGDLGEPAWPYKEEQPAPPFVREWTTGPEAAPRKRYRKAAPMWEGGVLRPSLRLEDAALFRGFTIHAAAERLLDPFPAPDSLAHARASHPAMPVASVTAPALEIVPDYAGAWIVTCVPHGISTDPRGIAILKRWGETDFYKCFFKSLLLSPGGCAGGWLVVPLAFFLGLNDTGLRDAFLTRYAVTAIHHFDSRVLQEDLCSYVSFCFHRADEPLERQVIPWTHCGETRLFPVSKSNDWVVCADLYRLPRSVQIKRFFAGAPVPADTQVLSLVLQATDGGGYSSRICMKYEPHKQYGSATSRNIATLTSKGCRLTDEEQQRVAEEFTIFVEQMRTERWDLFLSPMDDCGTPRRRIPFKLAFGLVEHIVTKVKGLAMENRLP